MKIDYRGFTIEAYKEREETDYACIVKRNYDGNILISTSGEYPRAKAAVREMKQEVDNLVAYYEELTKMEIE